MNRTIPGYDQWRTAAPDDYDYHMPKNHEIRSLSVRHGIGFLVTDSEVIELEETEAREILDSIPLDGVVAYLKTPHGWYAVIHVEDHDPADLQHTADYMAQQMERRLQ